MSLENYTLDEYEDDDEDVVEIDDTPEEDRGRQPMPKEITEKLENESDDELETYGKEVKEKIKQLKKVWHDERRAKEEAYREQQEALRLAQGLYQENQRLNNVISVGEKDYTSYVSSSAQQEYDTAKSEYKRAYEVGDADGIIRAQEMMDIARLKLQKAANFNYGALQTPENVHNVVQERLQRPVKPAVSPDEKAVDWQAKNAWFGQDEEMTATALGLHQKLEKQGVVVGSDEYYKTIDTTMRKRFSEYFGSEGSKRYNVVAPATRSAGDSKTITLSKSQRAIARKFGLTDKQYATELRKLNMLER